MVGRGSRRRHRQGREARLRVHGEVLAELAAGPPGVDPGVRRGRDDVEPAVWSRSPTAMPLTGSRALRSFGHSGTTPRGSPPGRWDRSRRASSCGPGSPGTSRAVGPERVDDAVIGGEHEVELMAALEVGVRWGGAHLGADRLRVAGQELRIVAGIERPAVLRLEAVAVERPDPQRHRVLVGPVRRQRRPGRLRCVRARDLAQVEGPEGAVGGAVAGGDRVEVRVVGVVAQRPLQLPPQALRAPGARRDLAAYLGRDVRRWIDVGVPVRRAESRRSVGPCRT